MRLSQFPILFAALFSSIVLAQAGESSSDQPAVKRQSVRRPAPARHPRPIDANNNHCIDGGTPVGGVLRLTNICERQVTAFWKDDVGVHSIRLSPQQVSEHRFKGHPGGPLWWWGED